MIHFVSRTPAPQLHGPASSPRVHFIVDGYGNIFAPLLPLLIPKLGLSFAEAGMLAMCFQLSASVSQLGFGHLADRWRPRLLAAGRTDRAVVDSQLRRARRRRC